MAPVVTASKSQSTRKRPRVLIVEDEPTLSELINDVVCKQVNCRVLVARNLAEAREMLRTQPVELMVADVHLPDGDGTTLIRTLRDHMPSGEAIVITGLPTVDGAIRAIRQGAIDFLPKPFTADNLVERVRKALERQAAAARTERRLDKLRHAVRRLNDARKTVSKKVDLLCNDLVSAYGELSRQLDVVRTQESFRKTVAEAADLEQLLCHAMDWMLRQMGYSNVAVWLAGDDAQMQLGAYIKYTLAGEPPLTDALKDGVVKLAHREGFVHLHTPAEMTARLTPAEAKALAGQNLVAANCTYLGETLAAVVMFRDAASPFTDDDAAALKAVCPLFAVALATLVRSAEDYAKGDYAEGDYAEGASDAETPFHEGADGAVEDDDNKDKRRPRKPDAADWWKRGEDPPF